MKFAVLIAAAGVIAASLSVNLAAAQGSSAVARGEQVYVRCAACHALAQDRVGPHHCGVIGRQAGSVPGYDYSPAMRGSGLTWDDRTLDRFLAGPLDAVPGTSMAWDGVRDPSDRADLIAYLHSIDDRPECRH